jgi:hypothetical protein
MGGPRAAGECNPTCSDFPARRVNRAGARDAGTWEEPRGSAEERCGGSKRLTSRGERQATRRTRCQALRHQYKPLSNTERECDEVKDAPFSRSLPSTVWSTLPGRYGGVLSPLSTPGKAVGRLRREGKALSHPRTAPRMGFPVRARVQASGLGRAGRLICLPRHAFSVL